MPELTLEALAERLEVVEKRLDAQNGVLPPTRDWRSVIGLFDGSEFMPQVDAEIQALRAAEVAGPAEETKPRSSSIPTT
jgi:hypothetical protein